MKKQGTILLLALLGACHGTEKNVSKSYVLAVAVETYERKGSDAIIEKTETDTVEASTALAAYSKGIQKYAAVLMHIQQFPDSVKGTKGLKIWDGQGNDIVPTIAQSQRDSVIMNFVQFARRSNIPYYDRVKDFELKLMTAR
ncbi:hypothetical protein [Parapedobacter koreensis]|uniref:Lipoprotein n=1 Tax=Parapedobacter koreensis TaxID=332977 RepID=A0A1H7PFB5_9SPHI|nr:hypothetical protein [Parapedobacter koreensis]SEL34480.1 hypothetical protein SAMN05421740_104349 [Parapedobacter koreensis]